MIESLCSFIYDISSNESTQSLFYSIICVLRWILRDKKASLLVVSPSRFQWFFLALELLSNNPTFYYMPISGWLSLMSNRFVLKKEKDPSDQSVLFRMFNGKDDSRSCCFRVCDHGISFSE